tara:strand:- start:11615 stop:11869 length:255 start_codon:yes stop_codon:yes gene_type:complete
MSFQVKAATNQKHAQINREFLIRWKEQDVYYTYLSTARKYIDLVGEEMAEKNFEKALASGKDKIIFKMRANKLRGALEITFVAK